MSQTTTPFFYCLNANVRDTSITKILTSKYVIEESLTNTRVFSLYFCDNFMTHKIKLYKILRENEYYRMRKEPAMSQKHRRQRCVVFITLRPLYGLKETLKYFCPRMSSHYHFQQKYNMMNKNKQSVCLVQFLIKSNQIKSNHYIS